MVLDTCIYATNVQASSPYKPLLKKFEIHPLGLSQFVKEKTRPNKQRAVLIWQVRVCTIRGQGELRFSQSK